MDALQNALQNAKLEKFVQNIISGMTQYEAYLSVYPHARNWKRETVDSKASALAHTDKIQARLQVLMQASASKAVLTRQQRMEMLSDIARDELQHTKQRMQAIDLLNKMDSQYVQKIETTVNAPISDVAEKVKAILES